MPTPPPSRISPSRSFPAAGTSTRQALVLRTAFRTNLKAQFGMVTVLAALMAGFSFLLDLTSTGGILAATAAGMAAVGAVGASAWLLRSVDSLFDLSLLRMSRILDHLKQPLFLVTADLKIAGPISRSAYLIFGDDFIGRPVAEALFWGTQLNPDEINAASKALEEAIGEDEMQWAISSDALPRQLIKELDESIHLHLRYEPLWNTRGRLEAILVIGEDTTRIDSLREATARQSREIKMFQELSTAGRRGVAEFMEHSHDLFVELTDKMRLGRLTPGAGRHDLMKLLHTLKGNAGAAGLLSLSSELHSYESLIRMTDEKEFVDPEFLRERTEDLSTIFRKFANFSARVFEIRSGWDVPANPQGGSGSATLFECRPKLQAILERWTPELGKKAGLVLEGSDLRMETATLRRLMDALGHLVRNAIDHGIETPAVRRAQGKNETGTIRIVARRNASGCELDLHDDGAGIDGEAVLRRAVELGLIRELPEAGTRAGVIAEVLFHPGFSSKKQADELSGHGVGLGAAREILVRMGGSLEIAGDLEAGSGFHLRIRLPDRRAALL